MQACNERDFDMPLGSPPVVGHWVSGLEGTTYAGFNLSMVTYAPFPPVDGNLRW